MNKRYALRIYRRDEKNQPQLLIIALIEMPFTISGMLDYYAEHYGFEREKLAGSVSEILDLTEIHQ